MAEDIFIKTFSMSSFSNIVINKVGHTHCYQKIDFIKRHDHCLQFVTSGKGILRVGNQIYQLKKYDLFLIPKSLDHSYESDKDDPYDNYWIHFNDSLGTRNFLNSINLTPSNPVISVESDKLINIFEDIISIASKYNKTDQLKLISKGYEILFEISRTVGDVNKNDSEDKISKTIKYMQDNYMNKITLDKLVNISCLSKSYYLSTFKSRYNKSPIQYLIEYRIGMARQFLSSNNSVMDSCFLSGFNDYSDFSTRFKKIVGMSPLKYKKDLEKSESDN